MGYQKEKRTWAVISQDVGCTLTMHCLDDIKMQVRHPASSCELLTVKDLVSCKHWIILYSTTTFVNKNNQFESCVFICTSICSSDSGVVAEDNAWLGNGWFKATCDISPWLLLSTQQTIYKKITIYFRNVIINFGGCNACFLKTWKANSTIPWYLFGYIW